MKKRFSSVYLLTAVLLVLLVVVAGEIASAKAKPDGKVQLTNSLVEGHERVIPHGVEKDATKTKSLLKRAKKNIRVGKTFLGYTHGCHQKSAFLSSAKINNPRYIFSQYSELLILYCVLQI